MEKTSQALDKIKDAEKPENAEAKAGKKGGRLHNAWAARDAKIKELEAKNKKLKQNNKELKAGGGAVSTSAVGAHDEEVSIQLAMEQEGKRRKQEFKRLPVAREKQEATMARGDLQRMLKDAKGDMAMARAQRSC